MKKKKRIVEKKQSRIIAHFVLAALIIAAAGMTALAFDIVSGGDFWLEAHNQDEHNFISLEWRDTGADRFYTIYQSDDEMVTWQTRSATYGKEISVLNVYPVSGSDGLKSWMESGGTAGNGKGLISVDTVLLSEFNQNPESWLRDSSNNYEYDVVVFGFRDWNGGASAAYDLSLTARNSIEAYILNGYGVLFGHDTATARSGNVHPNFVDLAQTYGNIEAHETGVATVGNDVIKSVNNGFLLQYPWTIEYGEELVVPLSHSFGQYANGIVWMEYVPPFNSGYPGPVSASSAGGTNNFYLTTWNNVAMIQTGHSNSTSYDSEQKVIANVLMYLAQYTDGTTADDYSAQDNAVPKKPEGTWGAAAGQLTLTAEDQGTPYWYKVESTSKHDVTEVQTSDIVKEYCTTGIAGFYLVEDGHDYIDFTETAAMLYPVTGVSLNYTFTDIRNYLHVKAVDHAGNVSEALRISPRDFDWEFSLEKTVDGISGEDQEFLYEIDYRLEPGGTVLNTYYGVITVPAGDPGAAISFKNVLPGVYTVTEKDANWEYQIDSSTNRQQTFSLLDTSQLSAQRDYLNNYQETAWIKGKFSIRNQMQEP